MSASLRGVSRRVYVCFFIVSTWHAKHSHEVSVVVRLASCPLPQWITARVPENTVGMVVVRVFVSVPIFRVWCIRCLRAGWKIFPTCYSAALSYIYRLMLYVVGVRHLYLFTFLLFARCVVFVLDFGFGFGFGLGFLHDVWRPYRCLALIRWAGVVRYAVGPQAEQTLMALFCFR